jgi:hypothetical protein
MKMIIDPQIEVPHYPKISEDCHILINDQKILIYGIEESLALTGENSLPIVKKILHLLNGKNSLKTIVESVNEDEKDQVPFILKYLYMKGLFEDYTNVPYKSTPEQNDTQKYFSRLVDITRYSKNRYEVSKKIDSYKIQIITNSILGVEFYKEISEVGFRNIKIIISEKLKRSVGNLDNAFFINKFEDKVFKKTIENISHIVCIFDRNIPRIFNIINKISYSNNQLFTLGFLKDKSCIIGPTFIPNETGCYECYEQRQIMNTKDLDSYLFYQKYLNNNETKPFSHTNYNKRIFIALLTSEIINISTLITMPHTIGYELEFDFIRMNLEKRKFNILPVCNVCSKKTASSSYILTGENL